MTGRPESRRGRLLRPWVTGVFALALLARLGFLFLADEPLLYRHQYTYLNGALSVAENPHPVSFVLHSDDWRTWDEHWTIAPLYYLLAALVFAAFGPHLLVLRLFQCLLDSAAAVGVAALGRQVAGPRGVWAGIVYALYWPAIELTSWTMTENAHTVLLVASLAYLAARWTSESRGSQFLGGALVGLSALARAVSSAFLGLLALVRLAQDGPRKGLLPAALVLLGGAAVILPWSARNAFLIGDPVLIETAAFENLWYTNAFVDNPVRRARQLRVIQSEPTPAAQRAAVLHFVRRGITEHPERIWPKIRANFWHFLRPEGLHDLLVLDRSIETWRQVGVLLLDDLPFLLAIPLFLVFVFAGRSSPARTLMLTWCGYYLLMIIVVFHNEIRYRSAFAPFLFAGAAGGIAAFGDPTTRRRLRAWAGAAFGVTLLVAVLRPYAGPAWRTVSCWRALEPALAAARQGQVEKAEGLASAAASRVPHAPWPWERLGTALAGGGHAGPAVVAFRHAARLAGPADWTPRLALAALLPSQGPAEDVDAAVRAAHALSWAADPWLALEVAWAAVPPPGTDRIDVGGDDYGAVRGFFHPLGGDPALSRPIIGWYDYDPKGPQPPGGTHRWTRHRAWLRLLPTAAATAYRVTLSMGSPFPSPLDEPMVRVQVTGAAPQSIRLGRVVRSYSLVSRPAPGAPIVVRIDSPTWTRLGEPADSGIRVDRMVVVPIDEAPQSAPAPSA